MNFKRFIMAVAFAVCGSANASTVLVATNGDVNFLFDPLPAGITLHMFDDDDNNNFASASASLSVPIPSIVGISGPQSGDFLASNLSGSLTLTSAPQFVLAVFDTNANAWVGDSSAVFYGNGNAVELTFNTSGQVYVVDVVPVPVPAAVWLFGTGLLGLVGVARRKPAA